MIIPIESVVCGPVIDYLGEVLLEKAGKSLRKEAEEKKIPLADVLLARGLISAMDVAEAVAKHFGIQAIDLEKTNISPAVLMSCPGHLANHYRAVPVSIEDNAITFAVEDPGDLDRADSLFHLLGVQNLDWVVATKAGIDHALHRYYGEPASPAA